MSVRKKPAGSPVGFFPFLAPGGIGIGGDKDGGAAKNCRMRQIRRQYAVYCSPACELLAAVTHTLSR